MRIALYEPVGPTSDPYPFGDTRLPELLALALDRSGHQVDRVAANSEGARSPTGDGSVVDYVIPQILAAFASSTRSRPEVWISSRVDHRSGARVGRAVCTALGIPYIVVQPKVDRSGAASHGEPTFPLQAIAEADAIFVLSLADAAAIGERLPSHADRIAVLPPFIDFDPVLPTVKNRKTNRASLATRLQLAPDVPWIVAAGPMATDRDLDWYRFLVEAMTPLVTLKWQLIVGGTGPRQAELGGLLTRIPGRNHRMLPIDDPGALLTLLGCGDLFVAPSADDRLPLPAIEAQAVGVPVVAPQTPDMQNVVSNGRTGMLAKPGNVASFGNAISFLLRHPNFRRTYAEQGPGWVARNFDMRLAVSRLDATLQHLAKSDRAPGVRSVD